MTNYDILKEYEEHQTPVPSYEEYVKLKELLKECVEVLNDAQRNYWYDDSIMDICSPVITKINQALGDW